MQRILICLLLSSATTWACSCGTNGTACSFLKGTEVVFMGKVVQDTGKAPWGDRFGRIQIEDVLHGLPRDLKEVEVDTMPHTSCGMILEKDERYVVYGSRDKNRSDLIHYHACSFSFRVRGKEQLYQALRAAENGNSSNLVGEVRKATGQFNSQLAQENIRVIAEAKDSRFETRTLSDGSFVFLNLFPGIYKVFVDSPGFIDDSANAWPRGPANVPARGCEYRSLQAIAAGRLSGVVRDTAGMPAAGIEVQAFPMDSKGKFDSSPIQAAKTDQHGYYSISPLPASMYIVGLNWEMYKDRYPYPPSFFPKVTERESASHILLGEAEEKAGIDLTLRPPRGRTMAMIKIVSGDGVPVQGALVILTDPSGAQRIYDTNNKSDSQGIIKVMIWEGETYAVEAFKFGVGKSSDLKAQTGLIKFVGAEIPLEIVIRPSSRSLGPPSGNNSLVQ